MTAPAMRVTVEAIDDPRFPEENDLCECGHQRWKHAEGGACHHQVYPTGLLRPKRCRCLTFRGYEVSR